MKDTQTILLLLSQRAHFSPLGTRIAGHVSYWLQIKAYLVVFGRPCDILLTNHLILFQSLILADLLCAHISPHHE